MPGGSDVEFRWIEHDLVDSTSERAFAELAAGRARNGDVHLALGQSAGRGSRGRRWLGAPGEGLYMSVVLLPGPPPFRPTALTVATALSVVEALTDLGLPPFRHHGPRLKWPNDVLVGDSKLCGILTESRGLDPRRPHFVVGIGMNVHQREFPPELCAERRVTSLARLGVDTTVRQAAEAVLQRLKGRLGQVRNDHRRLAEDFLAASGVTEHQVLIQASGALLSGRILGMTLSEGLELLTGEGRLLHLPLEFVQAIELQEEL